MGLKLIFRFYHLMIIYLLVLCHMIVKMFIVYDDIQRHVYLMFNVFVYKSYADDVHIIHAYI